MASQPLFPSSENLPLSLETVLGFFYPAPAHLLCVLAFAQTVLSEGCVKGCQKEGNNLKQF